MVKKHLLRIAMPKSWPIKRKGISFTLRPLTSRPFEFSLSLGVIVRDLLKYANTAVEVKKILNKKEVIVNKKVIKEIKAGVSLMDVVEFPKLNTRFRLVLSKLGKLTLLPIDEKESHLKPCKITGKKIINGGKVQFNLDDGRNLLGKEEKYKVGDTLIIKLDTGKVEKHLPLEKGMLVYLTAGKNVGMTATFESIKKFSGIYPDNIVLTSNGKTYETKKDYALVIGKDKAEISVE